MSANAERAIEQLSLREARVGTRREPSRSEREAKWHPQYYYVYNCIHDVPYVCACKHCKRKV